MKLVGIIKLMLFVVINVVRNSLLKNALNGGGLA